MPGAQKAQIEIAGMSFNVFHTFFRAEAHRTNFMKRPKSRLVIAAARTAIIQSSGCDVDEATWSGDVAVFKVDLLC